MWIGDITDSKLFLINCLVVINAIINKCLLRHSTIKNNLMQIYDRS